MGKNEPQLKACPFCGGPAKILPIPRSDLYAVGCDDEYMCMGNVNHLAMVHTTPERAAAAWNKRRSQHPPRHGTAPGQRDPALRQDLRHVAGMVPGVLRRLDAAVFTVIDPALAKDAANVIRLQRELLEGKEWRL